MIRWHTAWTGDEVPEIDGHMFCSLRDPRAEAKKWVEGYKDLLGDMSCAFVFGLAAGIHIDQLLRNFPQLNIVVIEPNVDLVRRLRSKILSWSDRVTVLENPNTESIKTFEQFHAIFEEAQYCVITHPASYAFNKEYFRPLEDFILGRSPDGFKYQALVLARHRSYFQSYFENYGFNGQEDILFIAETMLKSKIHLSEEDLIWVSLAELVH